MGKVVSKAFFKESCLVVMCPFSHLKALLYVFTMLYRRLKGESIIMMEVRR